MMHFSRKMIGGGLLCAAVLAQQSAFAQAADLLTIYQQAELSDPVYRQAIANSHAVAEGIPQARAQLLLPTVSMSGSISRNRQDNEFSGFGGAAGITSFTAKSYSVNLTQPLFHFERIFALKQADKRLQQAEYELSAAQQDLILRVAQRYFDVLAAEDSLEFANAEYSALQRQLEQAQQRFEVGLIAITDVQEAQAGADRAIASQILAQNVLDNAREALRELTLAYHTDLLKLGENLPLAAPQPNDINSWTELALTQNLALSGARLAADIAQQDIRVQYAGHLPGLDLVGRHGYSKSGGRFGDSQSISGEVGLQVSVPIYEGGRVVSRTNQARYRHTQALEQLEQQQRSVHRQTRQAFLGIQARISSVQALRQAVVSARTAVESTEAGFEVGTRTAVDVVTAERNLYQSLRDYARARYDYVLDIFNLKQAAGTLAEEDLIMANTWLTESDEPLATSR
ncbi:MAG: TolC family outer membrane protein [Gammaproteobacteria bacterium]|nr:TolC family outer membrane protein [Gammaproteobacteria bacterium]